MLTQLIQTDENPGWRHESGAVTAAFVGALPGIVLNGREGALEEGVVDDVAFAVFTVDDPLAFFDVAKAGVSGDGGGLLALLGVDE
jgi:hypothetical protein